MSDKTIDQLPESEARDVLKRAVSFGKEKLGGEVFDAPTTAIVGLCHIIDNLNKRIEFLEAVAEVDCCSARIPNVLYDE